MPGFCEALGCPLCTRCDPASVSCVAAPRTSCVASTRPDRTTLFLRRRNQRLVWRWRAGTALADGAFGDPSDGELYGLCLFAEDAQGAHRLFGNQMSRSDSWRPEARGGFVYHDRTRSDGVERLVLQTGERAQAAITARGSGPGIALPPLPVTTRLRVQPQSQSGACWESVHDPVDAGRNDDRKFRSPAASEPR